MKIEEARFAEQFERFQRILTFDGGGHPFVDFDEGVAWTHESYKPRLNAYARELLDVPSWDDESFGDGMILEHVISAIEVNNDQRNAPNNLVFWQNRFGHSNRAHRALLEARRNKNLCARIERQVFALYRDGSDEGAVFDGLAELTYRQYPLVAYLFFLKDMDRFMPILPSTFDKAFRSLNIDLKTMGNCSWENYARYNEALGAVRDALRAHADLPKARLIDAQSFCWLLERLEEPAEDVDPSVRPRGQDPGRKLGPRETSILEMQRSVVQTVRQAQGQIVERVVKPKELLMSEQELVELLNELLSVQEDRCALTGLPFQFRGSHDDVNMLPSLDRIDSSGHYASGNLQIVCRFINFWKQDTDNEEFKRLLLLVRGLEA
jgi:hypothetical protein